jgi:hypothetical protein
MAKDVRNNLKTIIHTIMARKLPFNEICTDFENYLKRTQLPKSNSTKSLLSRLRKIDKMNDGQTVDWLERAEQDPDPIKYLLGQFMQLPNLSNIKQGTIDNLRSALRSLGKFVFENINASVNLNSIKDFEKIACELVAQSAIFCDQKVFDSVKNGKMGSKENRALKGNPDGAWYHYTKRRARAKCEKRSQKTTQLIGGQVYNVVLDDNTYANIAIKSAIRVGLESNYKTLKYLYNSEIKFRDFEACHIWPGTCYDAQYHTSVANLVLLPRPLAGLTDHCDAVKKILQFRAWELFKWNPGGYPPGKPKDYDKLKWRS